MVSFTKPQSKIRSNVIALLSPFAQRPVSAQVSSLEWEGIWQFCGFHGVRPALYLAVERAKESADPPPWLTVGLTNFMQAHAFSTLQKTSEIVRLSQALEAANIEALFFKGAVLGEQVYGGASRREFNDTDLLVYPAQRPKAAELLEMLGYVPVVADPDIRKSFFDYAGQHTYFNRDTGSIVDLHWNFAGKRPFPVDAGSGLANRILLPIGGARVPGPCPDDLALILAGHGQKEGWASFGWALDFALFAARFPDFDWERAHVRAEAAGTKGSLLTAMLLIERLFGHPIDEALVAQASRQRRIVQDVDRIISNYDSLALRRLEDDLMGSFRLCDNQMQRVGVWWRLLTTRTVGDYEALPLEPRWWWLYYFTRPLRLAWQRIRHRAPMASELFNKQKDRLRR